MGIGYEFCDFVARAGMHAHVYYAQSADYMYINVSKSCSYLQSIGFKGILLFGTKEQKEKYLPKVTHLSVTGVLDFHFWWGGRCQAHAQPLEVWGIS